MYIIMKAICSIVIRTNCSKRYTVQWTTKQNEKESQSGASYHIASRQPRDEIRQVKTRIV